MKPLIVYYSCTSENTHRFVENLGLSSHRIPLSMKTEPLILGKPFVLICPTYAHDDGSNAVPKQVIRFLNDEQNRSHMIGVIGTGNRNFGDLFAHAGKVISKKCNVPLLYKLELSGTKNDFINVKQGLEKLWESIIIEQSTNKIIA